MMCLKTQPRTHAPGKKDWCIDKFQSIQYNPSNISTFNYKILPETVKNHLIQASETTKSIIINFWINIELTPKQSIATYYKLHKHDKQALCIYLIFLIHQPFPKSIPLLLCPILQDSSCSHLSMKESWIK
jgi:hypothetical protein